MGSDRGRPRPRSALPGETPLQRAGAVALIEGGFDPVDAVEGPDGVEVDIPDGDVAVTPSTGSVSRARRSRCRPRRRRNRCSRPGPLSPSGRGPAPLCRHQRWSIVIISGLRTPVETAGTVSPGRIHPARSAATTTALSAASASAFRRSSVPTCFAPAAGEALSAAWQAATAVSAASSTSCAVWEACAAEAAAFRARRESAAVSGALSERTASACAATRAA
ncbi:hypothetical protein E7X58_17715 [Streptomyces sp. A1499]|nr:hypothetical protein E7X58_17715 [Streptomyces sp. A1499]